MHSWLDFPSILLYLYGFQILTKYLLKMKTLIITLLMGVLFISTTAQVPQAFKYQMVVRDNSGEILQNQSVGIWVSIRDVAADGTILYREIFTETTNQFGLVNLEIGTGSPVFGIFSLIDWGTHSKFIEIEIDHEGGNNYVSLGTSQIISVPYALYSEKTKNTDDADADPTNELNTSVNLDGTDLKVTDAGGTITTDLGSLVDDADANPTNELNTSVNLDGTDLKVTDAGGTLTTDLEGLVDDADADPTNELQTVSKAGNTVTLSDGGGSFVDETADADANPTNELNTLVNLDGTELKVADAGGTITTDLSSLVDDADADPTNELNTSVSLDGTNLKVTDAGGTITTDLGSLVDDADANPTNELQSVSKAGSTVTLSDGGGSFIDETEDADANPDNEIQILSLDGNDLSISDGNIITLPSGMPPGIYGQTLWHNGTNWSSTSNLSNNGINIGIGTSYPSEKLDVNGTVKAGLFTGNGYSITDLNATNITSGMLNNQWFDALSDLGGGSGNTFLRKDGIWATPPGIEYFAGDDLELSGTTFSLENDIDVSYVRAINSDGLRLFNDGSKGIFVKDGGNVGIGTLNPSQKLDVDFGDIIVQGPESFDADGEQASLYLGTAHSYIRSEYGYGLKIGTYAASDAIAIKEISANVGIGTNVTDKSKMGLFTNNKDGSKSLPISHRLTIGHTLDNKVLRLIGPLGNFGHGARLNFGDGDYAYIEEDEDDYLTIHADRVAITGGIQGNTELEVAGRIWQSNTGGSILIGEGAGQNDGFSNKRNIAIGSDALYFNINQAHNIAIGDSTLYHNGVGSPYSYYGRGNIAIGRRSLFSNVTGSYNIAVGYMALIDQVEGKLNVAIGFKSLQNANADNNVAIGTYAGSFNANGSQNVFLGSNAGYANEGSGSIFLGSDAGYYEVGSNKLYIDNSDTDRPLIYGDFADREIVINGNDGDNWYDRTFFSNGSAGGTTYWYDDSDKQLMKNITTIPSSLDKVLQLRGVNYEWKETENRSVGQQMGFIAQEVQEVIPEVVDENDGHYSMQYSPITALLVEAVKEQQAIIDELRKEIEKLKNGE